MTASSNQAVRRIAPPSSRSVAPASTPPSAPPPAAADTWAAIAAIQQQLNSLIAVAQAPGAVAVEKSQAQVQNETQRKLLSTLKANLQPHPILPDGERGMWLTDLAQLAGIEKGVAHTQARKMNYRNRIGLSLEKCEPIGKSAFWVTVR